MKISNWIGLQRATAHILSQSKEIALTLTNELIGAYQEQVFILCDSAALISKFPGLERVLRWIVIVRRQRSCDPGITS
jgi:hypothetical protein